MTKLPRIKALRINLFGIFITIPFTIYLLCVLPHDLKLIVVYVFLLKCNMSVKWIM